MAGVGDRRRQRAERRGQHGPIARPTRVRRHGACRGFPGRLGAGDRTQQRRRGHPFTVLHVGGRRRHRLGPADTARGMGGTCGGWAGSDSGRPFRAGAATAPAGGLNSGVATDASLARKASSWIGMPEANRRAAASTTCVSDDTPYQSSATARWGRPARISPIHFVHPHAADVDEHAHAIRPQTRSTRAGKSTRFMAWPVSASATVCVSGFVAGERGVRVEAHARHGRRGPRVDRPPARFVLARLRAVHHEIVARRAGRAPREPRGHACAGLRLPGDDHVVRRVDDHQVRAGLLRGPRERPPLGARNRQVDHSAASPAGNSHAARRQANSPHSHFS